MPPTPRPWSLCKGIRSSVLVPACHVQRKSGVLSHARFPRQYIGKAGLNPDLNRGGENNDAGPPLQLLLLPKTCPGCGAYTQSKQPHEPGYFSANRKAVRSFVGQQGPGARERHDEAETFTNVLKHADQSLLQVLGLQNQDARASDSSQRVASLSYSPQKIPPICDRCHHLRHHNTAASISHPTLDSLREIIAESPFKHNHIYHVIDAADFPLSLVPSLQHNLSLSPQRSLNRRSKKIHYQHGSSSDVSYIITRSDLMAPKKEQVDMIMPYVVDVLRNALGGSAQNVRLGNVHCVSSKRGWWTKNLKEDIYHRGGGGWMVGKVNVGKSNLFETVFPKGHTQNLDIEKGKVRDLSPSLSTTSTASSVRDSSHFNELLNQSLEEVPEDLAIQNSSLPPMSKETPFPPMPLVSSSPGTTASPIRLSFGNRKGELIDLPGLNRGGLEPFVTDDHKHDLVMQNRIKPKQLTVKSGQALLIGGLVQITSITPDTTILAYPFVPLECHVSSAEKARSILLGQTSSGLSTIARPGVGIRMQTAGTFALKWDVTKARAGPLTSKVAVGLKATALPFVVLSTDILIEGCGWIELVAQVRKKHFLDSDVAQTKDFFDDKAYPLVEIMSPDGKHVGYRRPMGAWLLGGEKPVASGTSAKRPRRSMKGAKKMAKRASREGTSN